MKTRNLKIGDVIYYLDSNNSTWADVPSKTTVKNITPDGKLINYCECEECKKRIGTDMEYLQFEFAISVDNVFTDFEQFKTYYLNKVNIETNDAINKLI